MSPRPLNRVSRRLLSLTAVLAASGLALSACSADDDGATDSASENGAASGEFPRSIEHAFGTTDIPEQPERVATVGWASHDISLALGVAPVGIPEQSYGGNEGGATDWYDDAVAELGAEAPETYVEAEELPYEAIAATEPDVILAVQSAITQEQFDQLSDIAPVVAYPEDSPNYTTSWQDGTTLVGEALGKETEAEEVISATEQALTDYASEHADVLEGTTFIYGAVDPASADPVSVYTEGDARVQFLQSLGLEQAPAAVEAAEGAEGFSVVVSPENAASLESDLLITWAMDDSVREAVEGDDLLSSIPAITNDAWVLQTDAPQIYAISTATPLSVPWALDNTMPEILEAAEAAQG